MSPLLMGAGGRVQRALILDAFGPQGLGWPPCVQLPEAQLRSYSTAVPCPLRAWLGFKGRGMTWHTVMVQPLRLLYLVSPLLSAYSCRSVLPHRPHVLTSGWARPGVPATVALPAAARPPDGALLLRPLQQGRVLQPLGGSGPIRHLRDPAGRADRHRQRGDGDRHCAWTCRAVAMLWPCCSLMAALYKCA